MFNGKQVHIFLKSSARKTYEQFVRRGDQQSRILLTIYEKIKEVLKVNPEYGDRISKRLIPKEFRIQGVTNLRVVKLTNSWRMLYTITGNKIEIYVFILTMENHDNYDNRMNY